MKSGKSNWFSRAWSRLAGGRRTLRGPSVVSRRRAFFLESLEDRRVMAANLDPLANQSLLSGSPLFLALNGTSTTSAPLTYTVTSSNPSLVDAFLTSGNRSAKISVANFGDMTFELFENYAPQVTSHFISLASGTGPGLSGPFYDDTATNTVIFHRVINNFVIQAGDPTGTGAGGSPLDDFDDQFHVDLQHNRTGLLSMAKTLDDTNDSQFFITEGPQRHLDFNHSIFGMLTSGESVRDAISNVATNSSGRPSTDVVISSVSIFNDLQNRVLGLKAAHGASGEADITITVSDGSGQDVTRTFHVVVTPDGVNSNPFLQPITTPTITAGAPGTFQISGVDAEGDAIYYDAMRVGSVDYTVSVDHATGVVTVNPPAGFVGTLQVQIGVKNPNTAVVPGPGESPTQALNRVFDLQTIDVVVAPAAPNAPTGVNLLAVSDSGSSDSDNITNANTLRFEVGGVANGDVVRLFANDTLVGTANATGSTVTIETSSIAGLGQGAYQITATRVVSGVESGESTPLTVTYDTSPPAAFTSTPPTTATTTQLLTYDVQNPEEGTAGFVYSLSGQPAGVQINASTGVLTWTPTTAQSGQFQFSIIATDAAGNALNQAVNLDVAQFVDPLVDVQLSIVDANGNELTQIAAGSTFFLVVKAKETGEDPRRIISLYNDITFDSTLAEKAGDLIYANRFSTDNGLAVPNQGGFGTGGLFDELGSIDAQQLLNTSGPGQIQTHEEIYRIPMRALRGGTLTINADAADDSSNITLSWGKSQGEIPVASNEILFHPVSIQVQASFTPQADTIGNVSEDSSNNTLNVLANDLPVGSTDSLIIVAVSTPNHGGTVTISADKKSLLYTPASNFDQTETFTYTVQNTLGEQAVATVTVNVQPVNDPPQATNDNLTAGGGQTTLLDVLANDNVGIDTGETLAIVSVSSSTAGATLSLANGNTKISYTPPAGFSGMDTFTYTITDGHGGTATATATVTVTPASLGPVANLDTPSVAEDSTNNTLTVLANDTDGNNDPLTITAVGATNKGGTVTISQDKKTLIYTPAPNFQGEELFTYTVTDGTATATGQVRVTVTNVNDPPVANNDSATTFLNSGGILIDVLANDSSAGDPGETLSIASLGTAAHGSLAIDAATGKVRYIPAAGYSGPDSFTYVITDGQLTSQATVNVTVSPYQPMSVSGKVFLDANGNLSQELGDGPLAGVSITFQGTDANGAAVSKSVVTDLLGNYTIDGVLPGVYTLKQAEVALTAPGSAVPGSLGGTAVGSNQINVTITPEQAAAGLVGTNYVFTELPEQPNLGVSTGKTRLFAKRVTSALAVAVAPGSSASWLAPSGIGWGAFDSIQASLSSDGNTLHLNATDSQGGTKQIQVPISQVRTLDQENGVQVLQLHGDPSRYGIPTNGGSNNGGSTNGGSSNDPPVNANQPPVNQVPSAQSVVAGGTLTFSGSNAISVSDPDAGSQPLRVTLSATNGKLSLSTLVGLAFTSGTGSNDASMTFTGTVSALNAALSGATFTPNSGFTGAATVQITTNDQAPGGALIDIDSIAVAVTAASTGENEGEGEAFATAADELFSLLA